MTTDTRLLEDSIEWMTSELVSKVNSEAATPSGFPMLMKLILTLLESDYVSMDWMVTSIRSKFTWNSVVELGT